MSTTAATIAAVPAEGPIAPSVVAVRKLKESAPIKWSAKEIRLQYSSGLVSVEMQTYFSDSDEVVVASDDDDDDDDDDDEDDGVSSIVRHPGRDEKWLAAKPRSKEIDQLNLE